MLAVSVLDKFPPSSPTSTSSGGVTSGENLRSKIVAFSAAVMPAYSSATLFTYLVENAMADQTRPVRGGAGVLRPDVGLRRRLGRPLPHPGPVALWSLRAKRPSMPTKSSVSSRFDPVEALGMVPIWWLLGFDQPIGMKCAGAPMVAPAGFATRSSRPRCRRLPAMIPARAT